MILNQTQRDIQTEGLEETTKMTLSMTKENQAHIIKVLSENYKYPIESLIREIFSNNYDSHLMSGQPNLPIPVKLYNLNGAWIFETQDFGLGLSEEGFYEYYMKIGASTKRGLANVLGHYGAGCKSALAYTNAYEVICRKDGIENKFLIFKGDETPECTKIYTKNTEEINGVIVRVPLKNSSDKALFTKAINKQLCYFPTALISIENESFDYANAKLFENELFSWSEMYPSDLLHINFGGVHYPIEYDILEIAPIKLPLGIKIPLDSGITPFFSRESLMMPSSTKTYIKDKIKEIAEWFVNKYNEENKEPFNSIKECWSKLEYDTKYVKLLDTSFNITPLIKHSDVIPLEFKVKDYNKELPKYYYNLHSELLDEYTCIAEKHHSVSWKTKRISKTINFYDFMRYDHYKYLLANYIPSGHFKTYIFEKFGTDIKIVKKTKERKLINASDSINYFEVLKLNKHPKSEWRERIKEWQQFEKEFTNRFIDITKEESSAEFLTWVAAYKEKRKALKKSSVYNYTGLNKEEGDITISYCRSKNIGSGYMFEKKAIPISLLAQEKKLNLYFVKDEDKEKAISLFRILQRKINICQIGKTEIKKITHLHQFVKMEDFDKTKVFKRTMSSQLFGELIARYDQMFDNESLAIINNCIKSLKNNIEILRNYVDENGRYIKDNELLESMKALAKETNSYDYQNWDVYLKTKAQLDEYSFLEYFKIPSDYWSDEQTKQVNTLINQMLVYNKLYKNKFENFELVEKKDIEELVELEEIVA